MNSDKVERVRDIIQNTEFGLLDTVGKDKLIKLLTQVINPKDTMSKAEKEILEKFDDTIIIYRGISSDEKINFKKYGYGINWTTNIDVALWFANCRGGFFKSLIKAEIKKEDIICYWGDKDECEIIIDPNEIQKKGEVISLPLRVRE